MISSFDSVVAFLCISLLVGLLFFYLFMGETIKFFDKTENKKYLLRQLYSKLFIPLLGALVLAFSHYMSQKLSLGELALCLVGGYCMGFAYMLFSFKKTKMALVQLFPVLVMCLYIFFKMEFMLVIALTLIFVDVVLKYFIFKIVKKIFKFLNLTK